MIVHASKSGSGILNSLIDNLPFEAHVPGKLHRVSQSMKIFLDL